LTAWELKRQNTKVRFVYVSLKCGPFMYATQEVVMENLFDLTRIGCSVLVLGGMGVSPVFGWDGEGSVQDGWQERSPTYEILTVSRNNGLHHRFQATRAGRSMQAQPAPRMNLNPGNLNRPQYGRGSSRALYPVILYPWIWGYNYGYGETPEDFLVEYLEELQNRQELAMEEEAPTAPPVPAPPPLIIEEQCGKYVRVPWPESGVLFEPREEHSCPETN